MSPRIGSLFSGYGGLDMGVTSALGGSVAWHVEYDKAPSKILTHHWPDVPNYGDVTAVDWSSVEPVDIITGGSPCQDLSHAGKRQGMTEGTRSNLWVAMREAIAQLRPSMVVWENVRGAYSAAADSELEPCAGCVGDGSGVHLRALGRVLGDLSDLGYDCRWHGLRAADIGAPHGRFRVFVVALDARHDARRPELRVEPEVASVRPAQSSPVGLLPTPAAYDVDRGGPQHPDKRKAGGHSVTLQDAVHGLLPTPATRDFKGHNQRGDTTCLTGALMPTPRATDGTKGGPNQRDSSGDLMLPSAVTLLPTPAVNDMGEGKTVEAWDEWTAKMQAAHGNGNGHGKSLAIEAQRVAQPLRWVDETPDGYIPPHTLVGDDSEWEECPECGCIWDEHDFDGFCMGSCGGNKCNGRQFYRQVPDEAQRLLPTPMVGSTSEAAHGQISGDYRAKMADALQNWGQYADAIARWEALTRPAPAPTQPSKKGTPQLSPTFSEWLMGLPEGHVTGVPGLSRNDQLKALGNGVVPQQAAAALLTMLAWSEVAA